MDTATMTERYNDLLKIRTDIRKGGSVRVCDIIDHNLGCNWLETDPL